MLTDTLDDMNQAEARSLLHTELLKYRTKDYSALLYLMEQQDCFEVKGSSGVLYQLEVQAFWDNQPHDVLRVIGSIDDRGPRAFSPLVEAFLITPGGQITEG